MVEQIPVQKAPAAKYRWTPTHCFLVYVRLLMSLTFVCIFFEEKTSAAEFRQACKYVFHFVLESFDAPYFWTFSMENLLRQSIDELSKMIFHDVLEQLWFFMFVWTLFGEKSASGRIYIYIYELHVWFADVWVRRVSDFSMVS